jgi:cellulose synthase/poly-beta-1,6-N-acetylglucosamine synthase-like glycosyltransferase
LAPRYVCGTVKVFTADETALTKRSVGNGLIACGLSAALVAPGIVSPGYARVGAYAILVVGLLLSIRLAVSGLVACKRRAPPAPDPNGSLPTASIVITAYNEADVLRATIEACTTLEYPDEKLEIVVSYEAAPNDGTTAIASAAADRHRQVMAVERPGPPAGKASAVNYALTHTSGEIIASLDANQRLEPDALERAVRWFRDEDVWCVKGRCFGTNPDASMVALCATVERGVIERTEFYARDLLGGFAFFTGGQAFFRADVLAEIGAFDESILLEDLELSYRLHRAGGSVRIDPGIVTRESNPATFEAWWNQRKRWARGGLQVARRYLGSALLVGPPSPVVRLDFAATTGSLLALPLVVLSSPLVPVALWTGAGGIALERLVIVTVIVTVLVTFVAPVAASYLVFALDARDGYGHATREYAAPFVLWAYFAVQSGALITSFLDEIVLRHPSVYVTS